MTFRSWLKKQEGRNDKVGDVARDIRGDKCLHNLWATPSIRRHIQRQHSPVDTFWTAFDAAVAEWRQYVEQEA